MSRSRLIVALVLLVGSATCCWIVYEINKQQNLVRDAYALWWTGSMVGESVESEAIYSVETYEDLRPAFERLTKQHGRPFAFEDIGRRVVIDFDLIRRHLEEDFDTGDSTIYVRLRTGAHGGEFVDADPNEIIRNSLKERRRNQTGREKSNGTEVDSEKLPSEPE